LLAVQSMKVGGQGKCIYANGEIYEGGWIDGMRDGQGTYIYASGAVYEGRWKHSTNGQGKMTWPDGAVYVGNWKDKGILT